MEENPENIAPNDADDSLSFLESELETLQSIYINEIEVKQDDDQKCTSVSIDLHPATADKPEEQYVKMTLKFTISKEYPHSIPGISIHNPRGLSDEKINSTYQDLISIAEKRIGNSMLFEIIENAKEHLTAGNRPCGECAICLYGFSESDVFIKTDCYHYFHSHCLARYAKNVVVSEMKKADPSTDDAANNELLCPMCRVPIQFPGVDESYPPPSTGDDEYLISEQILEMQGKMADLFQKQLEKGGIINIEAEKNKYLLEISNVPTVTNVEKSSAEESDIPGKGDESTSNASQLPQNDKTQNTKETKSDVTKPDEKWKHNKKFNKRGNHNAHNFSRNSRKQKTQCDSYEEDFNGDDCYREEIHVDVDTGLPQSKDNAYPSPRSKVSSGPRRWNNAYNRGNYTRYPWKNSIRPNSNPYQRNFDRTDPDRRFDSGKDVSPQSDSSCANKDAVDSPLEETKDSQRTDSFNKQNNFDRRGKNRGRFPRNNHRGRGGNYSGYAPRKDNYNRNRQDDNYESHRERDGLNNSHPPNACERETVKDGEAFNCEEDAQYQRDPEGSGRSHRNNPRRQSRGSSHRDGGVHEETSRQEENSHEADPKGDDAASHKNPETLPHWDRPRRYPAPREGNFGKNGNRQSLDSSESRDERFKNQFHNRRNEYEENGRHHQRHENYSQNSGPRRNTQRDGYGSHPDRRGFQQDYGDRRGGRGRNNPRYQNRNSGFEGGSRRNQENSTFQNRSTYRSSPRKFEDTHSNENNKTGNVDQVASEGMNGSKNIDESNVKAFVPKEDSSVTSFGGDPESHKVPYPPPGFSNPLKKVVYGLEAAKPPPGFPRR